MLPAPRDGRTEEFLLWLGIGGRQCQLNPIVPEFIPNTTNTHCFLPLLWHNKHVSFFFANNKHVSGQPVTS
jgi:hypothetical protein